MSGIQHIRERVTKGRRAIVLGEPPRQMRYAVRQTREMMRQLTSLVVKVHGQTSIHHLQLISEWAEAEVSRRLLWMEFRNRYPGQLTTEQVCMIRKDTQRYAAEKSRCIKELELDVNRMDAYDRALSDDNAEPELIDLGDSPIPGFENTAEAFSTTCDGRDDGDVEAQ